MFETLMFYSIFYLIVGLLLAAIAIGNMSKKSDSVTLAVMLVVVIFWPLLLLIATIIAIRRATK